MKTLGQSVFESNRQELVDQKVDQQNNKKKNPKQIKHKTY